MRSPPLSSLSSQYPRMYCAGARKHQYARPHGKKGKKVRQGGIDNEKRDHHDRPRGRPHRPHQCAVPAMPAPLPLPVPAVPVPTVARTAAVARLVLAAALAADADMVLTRAIAPRRVPAPAWHGCPRRPERRETARKRPLSGPIWRAWGRGGPGGPPGVGPPHNPLHGRRAEGVALYGRVSAGVRFH